MSHTPPRIQPYYIPTASERRYMGKRRSPGTPPTAPAEADCSPTSAGSSASSTLLTPTTPQTSRLLNTPPEILHRVLCASGVDGLKALTSTAGTCRELRSFIYQNPDQALWRDIHLKTFDDPDEAAAFPAPRRKYDWKARVQNREFVSRILREWGPDRYEALSQYIDLICETVLDVYLDLPPCADDRETPIKQSVSVEDPLNSTTLEAILRSEAFAYIYYNLAVRESKQSLRPLSHQPTNPNRRPHKEVINPIISRLHCVLSPEFDADDILHRQHRGWLREVVYSGSNFTVRNDWAPLTSEGRVNWDIVDAVASVMMANGKDEIAKGEETWRHAVLPQSYGIEPMRGWGWQGLERPVDLPEDAVWDWAGVEGQFFGSYAYLDYSDWLTLNEPRLVMLRWHTNQLDLCRYSEATGDLMLLNLQIDKDAEACSFSHVPANARDRATPMASLETHLPTSDLLPPIYFHGTSRHQDGYTVHGSTAVSSHCRGVVRLTADNPPQIRWTFVIRYGGEDRWKLECVQPGGRGSRRGMFGIWTDAMKEDHSPNGPVWYWRV